MSWGGYDSEVELGASSSSNLYLRLGDAWRNLLLKAAIIVLLVLWVLALVTHHMMDGFVHVFLVLALVLFLITMVRGTTP
jgi:hypothetical protein